MFNAGRPQQALAYLGIDTHHERWRAARWLLQTAGLDKEVLGDFLSQPVQEPLLDAYIRTLDLAGQNLEVALRNTLCTLKLPDEAHQAFRIIEKIAKRWSDCCDCIPTAAPPMRPEAAYILSVAIITLNTELHDTASAKKHTTCAQFISNLKGMGDEVAALSDNYLKSIYQSIAADELVLGGGYTSCSTAVVPPVDLAQLRLRMRAALRLSTFVRFWKLQPARSSLWALVADAPAADARTTDVSSTGDSATVNGDSGAVGSPRAADTTKVAVRRSVTAVRRKSRRKIAVIELWRG